MHQHVARHGRRTSVFRRLPVPHRTVLRVSGSWAATHYCDEKKSANTAHRPASPTSLPYTRVSLALCRCCNSSSEKHVNPNRKIFLTSNVQSKSENRTCLRTAGSCVDAAIPSSARTSATIANSSSASTSCRFNQMRIVRNADLAIKCPRREGGASGNARAPTYAVARPAAAQSFKRHLAPSGAAVSRPFTRPFTHPCTFCAPCFA